jgi:hypothetical protein
MEVPEMTRMQSCQTHVGHRLAILVLIACLLLLNPFTSVAATPVATPVMDSSPFPAYEITASLDTTKRRISGDLSLNWTNTTGNTLDFLYFRLYPNATYYGDAELTIDAIKIDARPVVSALADDRTVLQVTPASPIPAGRSLSITLRFETMVPADSTSGFGIFQYASATGIWNLANWYPILAGYEPGKGWYLQPPTSFGDPTFSETAEYRLTLTLPGNLTIVSTGESTSQVTDEATGTVTTEITTGPAREFAMALLQASGEPAEAKAGDVTVRVTLPDDQQIPGLAAFMADTAAQTLALYETWMGDYSSGEFDITVAALSGANGVSWSGMTWFDLHPITADGELSDQEKVGLAFVILHEVGHQWIADIIGCNNNDHGFMSEGLVNALAVLAAEELYGEERATLYLQSWVAGPYTSLLNDGRDGIADAPLTNDTNGVIRSLLIYGKAAIGFIAVREEIGEAAFLSGLANYGADFRFEISEPDDLLAAFEGASDESLDDLWSFWFNEQKTTRADVTTVLGEFGEDSATPAA